MKWDRDVMVALGFAVIVGAGIIYNAYNLSIRRAHALSELDAVCSARGGVFFAHDLKCVKRDEVIF